jgi:hypothetical protein
MRLLTALEMLHIGSYFIARQIRSTLRRDVTPVEQIVGKLIHSVEVLYFDCSLLLTVQTTIRNSRRLSVLLLLLNERSVFSTHDVVIRSVPPSPLAPSSPLLGPIKVLSLSGHEQMSSSLVDFSACWSTKGTECARKAYKARTPYDQRIVREDVLRTQILIAAFVLR